MKIYCGIEKQPTLYEFLKKGFSVKEGIGIEEGTFVKTYFDKELTELQCKEARRSFEDLLDISQTYYPKTTEKALAKILNKLAKGEDEEERLYAYFCTGIGKVVFRREGEDNLFHYLEKNNEMDKRGAGKYTGNEIKQFILDQNIEVN